MIGHCSKVDCELFEKIPMEKRPVMHRSLKVDIVFFKVLASSKETYFYSYHSQESLTFQQQSNHSTHFKVSNKTINVKQYKFIGQTK